MRSWNWRLVLLDQCEARDLTHLDFAYEVYLDRQEKNPQKRRWAPLGVRVPFGNKAKGTSGYYWYPLPSEVRGCCTDIAPPTFRYPYVFQRHCRTARHVAMLFNVDERHLTALFSARGKQSRCAECKRFILSDDYICGRCREIALSP